MIDYDADDIHDKYLERKSGHTELLKKLKQFILNAFTIGVYFYVLYIHAIQWGEEDGSRRSSIIEHEQEYEFNGKI